MSWKNTSLRRMTNFCQFVKLVSHFWTLFKFCVSALIVSRALKQYQELWLSKNNLNFLKEVGFCGPPHVQFFFYILMYNSILMDFCMKHPYLIASWKLAENWNFLLKFSFWKYFKWRILNWMSVKYWVKIEKKM